MQEIEQKREEQKKRDQELAQKQKDERSEKERIARIEEAIQMGKVEDQVHGARKFYFVAQDGKIPCLMLSDKIAEKLEKGLIAIVEYPQREFMLVYKASADKLYSFDKNLVRFYQRHF